MCRKSTYLISLIFVLNIAVNASADLVAHLSFDEGSGNIAYDTSGNGNDGTLNGDPQWVAGQTGGALEFDGDGDYVEIPRIIQDDFTLAAWIKTDTPGLSLGNQGYQGSGLIWSDVAGVANDFILAVLGTKLSFFCGNPDTSLNSDTDIVTGEWMHVTATRSAQDRQIGIYINGQHEKTVAHSNSSPLNALDTIAIGGNVLDSRYYTGLIDEVRFYDHVLSPVEVMGALEGKPWPYSLGPDPADGALHADTWVTLSWIAGSYAVSHDVYMGDNFDDVNDGAGDTFRGNQTDTYYIAGFPGNAFPEGLVPGTTYYWRIDEVNEAEPNSPWKGQVWSFLIPPKTAYFPVPADGAELVALDAKLSWTAGFGAKLHYVVFGEDFDEVSNRPMGTPSGATNYSPGPLNLAKTYYWRIDEFDGTETYKGQVWSFTTLGAASNPNPANNAADIKPSVILTWEAGSVAASHEVYFGKDADAVKNATTASPEYKGPKALGEESFNPGKLLFNTTYYWRVDEVNDASTDSPWAGKVWSFTTGDFFVIDDFEDYDTGENQIWYAWHDGLGYGAPGTDPYYAGNGTGAAVGDENSPSYAEETIVHGGGKSMPVSYDNNKQGYAYYSEVEHKLTDQRDWTERGVGELSIWFRGISDNSAEPLYVAVSNSTGAPAIVVHDDANAAQIDVWTQWVIPLQAFADQGIVLTDVDKIAIGLGTQGNMTIPGGSGKIYIDDIRLYQPRETVE
jgi:hypothetical protein